MRTLIIEDEKIAADNLEQMLADIDSSIEVVEKIGTIRNAVDWLKNNKVDLIFLDIQLSDGISFKIFDKVDITTPIIFTTAYDKYAIKAFELNSVDYLLKPIKKDKLQNAVNKFRSLFQNNLSPKINYSELLEAINKKEYQQRFVVYFGSKIITVNTSDIAYFYLLEKNTFLHTVNGRTFGINYSLEKLESILNPADFFRINRQFLISINSIKNMHVISTNKIKVELNPPFNDDVYVSFHKASEFKSWLNK